MTCCVVVLLSVLLCCNVRDRMEQCGLFCCWAFSYITVFCCVVRVRVEHYVFVLLCKAINLMLLITHHHPLFSSPFPRTPRLGTDPFLFSSSLLLLVALNSCQNSRDAHQLGRLKYLVRFMLPFIFLHFFFIDLFVYFYIFVLKMLSIVDFIYPIYPSLSSSRS